MKRQCLEEPAFVGVLDQAGEEDAVARGGRRGFEVVEVFAVTGDDEFRRGRVLGASLTRSLGRWVSCAKASMRRSKPLRADGSTEGEDEGLGEAGVVWRSGRWRRRR